MATNFSFHSFDKVFFPYILCTENPSWEFWVNNTYDISDVVLYIKAPATHWSDGSKTTVNSTGFYEDIQATVYEVSTNYGRCYTIYFYRQMRPEEYYTLAFDLSQHEELLVYIHEKGNEIGLHWSFWPRTPAIVPLRRRDEVSATVQKNYFTSLKSVDHCEEDETYSLPDCVTKWAKNEYKHIFEKSNRTGIKSKQDFVHPFSCCSLSFFSSLSLSLSAII